MGDSSAQIVQVLSQALDSDPNARKQGEELLSRLATQSGFGHALVHASLRQASCHDTLSHRSSYCISDLYNLM